MSITGLLKGAVLVSFTGLPEEYEGTRVVCATVIEDFKGRLPEGYWLLTSNVVKVEDDIVSTLNSHYKIVGDLEQVTLPIETLPTLRQGAAPQSLKAMLEKGFTYKAGMLQREGAEEVADDSVKKGDRNIGLLL